ncbi:MAG TPA: arsenic resistance N-acetyltransferase ArsN2 [Gammaproteobacteria bacterium]|nr:arsenic resistance N-acetyltransferase ArsN2 [Gammaproteobacteria bacterium]
MRPSIVPFAPHDEAAMDMLLQAAELPTEDITPEILEHFLVAHLDKALIGCAGVEILGEVGLLRSVAVDEAHRGAGLGKDLVAAAEELAKQEGVQRLYLLTTTAEGFFVGLGYRKLPREEAPADIAGTEQFASLCPSSSSFMMKTLAQ